MRQLFLASAQIQIAKEAPPVRMLTFFVQNRSFRLKWRAIYSRFNDEIIKLNTHFPLGVRFAEKDKS
jgi:hypothetical protein